jgi:NADP-dependent 3-hydroxy acid dehydrogenase YdfG
MGRPARSLKSKVVIITGASSGIGAATAVECGRHGMRVVLAARRADELNAVAAEVETAGGEALVCIVDVSNVEQINGLIATAIDKFGTVDVLLANAGVPCHSSVSSIEDDDLRKVIDVNLLGMIRCCKAVIQQMRAQKQGHILVVSSVITELAWPDDAVYAATKAGVQRFTRGLRNEMAGTGIWVTDIIPGVIDTPFTTAAANCPKAEVKRTARDIVDAMCSPVTRIVTPRWYIALLYANKIIPSIAHRVLGCLIENNSRC